MSARALSLLRLATYSPDQRDSGWREFVTGRNERVSRAMLRDAVKRGYITSEDVATMQLTEAGRKRMEDGQRLADLKDDA